MTQDPSFQPIQQPQMDPEIVALKEEVATLKQTRQKDDQDEILENVVGKYQDYDVKANEVDKYMFKFKETGFDYEDMSDVFTKAYLWETKSEALLKNAKELGAQDVVRKQRAAVDSAKTPTTRDDPRVARKPSGDLHTDLMRQVEELQDSGEWDI